MRFAILLLLSALPAAGADDPFALLAADIERYEAIREEISPEMTELEALREDYGRLLGSRELALRRDSLRARVQTGYDELREIDERVGTARKRMHMQAMVSVFTPAALDRGTGKETGWKIGRAVEVNATIHDLHDFAGRAWLLLDGDRKAFEDASAARRFRIQLIGVCCGGLLLLLPAAFLLVTRRRKDAVRISMPR